MADAPPEAAEWATERATLKAELKAWMECFVAMRGRKPDSDDRRADQRANAKWQRYDQLGLAIKGGPPPPPLPAPAPVIPAMDPAVARAKLAKLRERTQAGGKPPAPPRPGPQLGPVRRAAAGAAGPSSETPQPAARRDAADGEASTPAEAHADDGVGRGPASAAGAAGVLASVAAGARAGRPAAPVSIHTSVARPGGSARPALGTSSGGGGGSLSMELSAHLGFDCAASTPAAASAAASSSTAPARPPGLSRPPSGLGPSRLGSSVGPARPTSRGGAASGALPSRSSSGGLAGDWGGESAAARLRELEAEAAEEAEGAAGGAADEEAGGDSSAAAAPGGRAATARAGSARPPPGSTCSMANGCLCLEPGLHCKFAWRVDSEYEQKRDREKSENEKQLRALGLLPPLPEPEPEPEAGGGERGGASGGTGADGAGLCLPCDGDDEGGGADGGLCAPRVPLAAAADGAPPAAAYPALAPVAPAPSAARRASRVGRGSAAVRGGRGRGVGGRAAAATLDDTNYVRTNIKGTFAGRGGTRGKQGTSSGAKRLRAERTSRNDKRKRGSREAEEPQSAPALQIHSDEGAQRGAGAEGGGGGGGPSAGGAGPSGAPPAAQAVPAVAAAAVWDALPDEHRALLEESGRLAAAAAGAAGGEGSQLPSATRSDEAAAAAAQGRGSEPPPQPPPSPKAARGGVASAPVVAPPQCDAEAAAAAELAACCEFAAAEESAEPTDALGALLLATLRSVFGLNAFKPGQLLAMRRVLEHRSTILVLPTGGGKSLAYQLPAFLSTGITLVVSPLLALISDQLASLPPALRGTSVTSDQTWAQKIEAYDALSCRDATGAAATRIVYVAPERLANAGFQARLRNLPPVAGCRCGAAGAAAAAGRGGGADGRCCTQCGAAARPALGFACVDEAHCLSEWSHNFRPAYMSVGAVLESLGVPAVLGLTATATERTARSICTTLRLPEGSVLRVDLRRANLKLDAELVKPAARMSRARELLAAHVGAPPRTNADAAALIYCNTRWETEETARELHSRGWRAEAYHAGRTSEERKRVQVRDRGLLSISASFTYDGGHFSAGRVHVGQGAGGRGDGGLRDGGAQNQRAPRGARGVAPLARELAAGDGPRRTRRAARAVRRAGGRGGLPLATLAVPPRRRDPRATQADAGAAAAQRAQRVR